MTKISPKIIEEVVGAVAGDDTLPLVRVLRNKKNISEFKLAESLRREINTTRNMLYRLYDVNLVYFTRKKDKKKGWYIYYWTFNDDRVGDLLKDLKKQRLEKLRERLSREKNNQFFVCEGKCIRLDFEQATDFEYKCPECGLLLHQEDNSKKIAELERTIVDIENDLAESIKQMQKSAVRTSILPEQPKIKQKKTKTSSTNKNNKSDKKKLAKKGR